MPSRVIEGTPIVSAEGHSRSETNLLALIRMDGQASQFSASPVNPAKEVSGCSSITSATSDIFAEPSMVERNSVEFEKTKGPPDVSVG